MPPWIWPAAGEEGEKMNSRQLEYFLAVARELNFTKAAESMFVSQTAVTQQIKVLEEQLGVHLFERTKRKVALTPAGRVFQEEAVDILKRIDLAAQRTRAVSSGFTGSLNVGFALGIGNTEVAERIQAFHQKYPNISMKFVNHSPSMLMKSLRSGEVDLILMPLFDEAFYGDIAYRKIAWDNLIAVLPKNHRLAQNQYITWRELKDEPLILAASPEKEVGEGKMILENFLRRGYQPQVLEPIEDVETIFFMISANMGITILPAYLTASVYTRGRLAAVPFGGVTDQVDIIAGWMPDKASPSLERILPFLEGGLSDEEIGEQEPVMLSKKALSGDRK